MAVVARPTQHPDSWPICRRTILVLVCASWQPMPCHNKRTEMGSGWVGLSHTFWSAIQRFLAWLQITNFVSSVELLAHRIRTLVPMCISSAINLCFGRWPPWKNRAVRATTKRYDWLDWTYFNLYWTIPNRNLCFKNKLTFQRGVC